MKPIATLPFVSVGNIGPGCVIHVDGKAPNDPALCDPASAIDVLIVFCAFQGDPYPFGCPDDPCQDNMFEPCP